MSRVKRAELVQGKLLQKKAFISTVYGGGANHAPATRKKLLRVLVNDSHHNAHVDTSHTSIHKGFVALDLFYEFHGIQSLDTSFRLFRTRSFIG